MEAAKSVLIFVLAGLCEIGGGYLVWQWLRGSKPAWVGLLGAVILIAYGIVATWQTANFARTLCYLWPILYSDVIVIGLQVRQLHSR